MSADAYAAQTVTAWLRYVHGHAIDAQLDDAIVVLSAPTPDGWRSSCYTLDELDDAGRKARDDSDDSLNVYYRTTLLGERVDEFHRGAGKLSKYATHYAADVDVLGDGHVSKKLPPTLDEAVRLIDATLAPSAILSSGGGLYPVWRFVEPLLLDDDAVKRYRDIGARLDAALGSHGYDVDATLQDMTRVIRPAGVMNNKPKRDARPVTVLRGHLDGAGDYTLDAIDAALPKVLAPTSRKALPKQRAPQAAATPRPRRIGDERTPWELFAQRYTLADVLNGDTRHDWEQVADVGGMEAWRRVGSSSEYSLKQAPSGAVIVWSSTLAAELDIDGGAALDLFGLACRLAGRNPVDVARGVAA